MRKQSSTKTYKVSISKTFEYPSCVITKDNYLRDLHEKALNDFFEQIRSNIENGQSFDFQLVAEYPFKVRTRLDPKDLSILKSRTIEGCSLDYLIRIIVDSDIEEKYGKMDPDKNPDIFIFPENVTEKDGTKMEFEPELKEEITEEIDTRMERYLDLLKRTVL